MLWASSKPAPLPNQGHPGVQAVPFFGPCFSSDMESSDCVWKAARVAKGLQIMALEVGQARGNYFFFFFPEKGRLKVKLENCLQKHKNRGREGAQCSPCPLGMRPTRQFSPPMIVFQRKRKNCQYNLTERGSAGLQCATHFACICWSTADWWQGFFFPYLPPWQSI